MNPADLAPIEVIPDPKALKALQRRRDAERAELFRIAAQSALVNGGTHLDRRQLALAKKRAAVRPLQGPLGTGEPVFSHQRSEEPQP